MIFEGTDYEFSMTRFLAGGHYELELSQTKVADDQPACAHGVFEMAVEAVAAFQLVYPSVVCPDTHGVVRLAAGGDH